MVAGRNVPSEDVELVDAAAYAVVEAQAVLQVHPDLAYDAEAVVLEVLLALETAVEAHSYVEVHAVVAEDRVD